MSELVCVTNSMRGVRPCVRRDQHAEHCDGHEYHWMPESEREGATGRPCPGCLPRTARHGLLCTVCWAGVLDGVNRIDRVRDLFAGVDRAVQRDNAGVRHKAGPPIPLTSLQLSLDEVEGWFRSYPGSPEAWVATVEGAQDATRFARAFWSLTRNHPTEETAHRIRRTRCPECRQLALVWNPPQFFGDEVTVTCRNEECGHSIDQASFEELAVIEGRAA